MMILFVKLGNFLVFKLFRLHPGLSWFQHGGAKLYVNLQLNCDGVNVV